MYVLMCASYTTVVLDWYNFISTFESKKCGCEASSDLSKYFRNNKISGFVFIQHYIVTNMMPLQLPFCISFNIEGKQENKCEGILAKYTSI